jgi:hypothetical protein
LASWEARFNQAAIVHDGAIWIFGGKDSSGMVYKDLWKSPNGHTWELVTDELNNIGSREFSTLASFDNFLWLAGGFHEELGRYYSDLWKSSDGKEWTRILPGSATLSTVLSYSGGILWVQTYFSCPITLEALTSTNGINWTATSVASLAGNSVPLNATIHNNKFWALGVFDPNSGSSQPTTETYSSSDFKSWTCVTPEAPWLPRDNAYCVSFKNKIWLIGGSIQIDHDVFLPLSDVWVSPAE